MMYTDRKVIIELEEYQELLKLKEEFRLFKPSEHVVNNPLALFDWIIRNVSLQEQYNEEKTVQVKYDVHSDDLSATFLANKCWIKTVDLFTIKANLKLNNKNLRIDQCKLGYVHGLKSPLETFNEDLTENKMIGMAGDFYEMHLLIKYK